MFEWLKDLFRRITSSFQPKKIEERKTLGEEEIEQAIVRFEKYYQKYLNSIIGFTDHISYSFSREIGHCDDFDKYNLHAPKSKKYKATTYVITNKDSRHDYYKKMLLKGKKGVTTFFSQIDNDPILRRLEEEDEISINRKRSQKEVEMISSRKIKRKKRRPQKKEIWLFIPHFGKLFDRLEEIEKALIYLYDTADQLYFPWTKEGYTKDLTKKEAKDLFKLSVYHYNMTYSIFERETINPLFKKILTQMKKL